MQGFYLMVSFIVFFALNGCNKSEEVGIPSHLHCFNSKGNEIRMKDGGFLFTEGTGWNSQLTRFDKTGKIIWTNDLSKKLIHAEAYYSILSICETNEGGLAGFSLYQDTVYGFHFLKMFKVDQQGTMLWERLVNIFYSNYSYNFSPFINDGNDNFISTYFLYSNGLSSALIKIDSTGNLLLEQNTDLVSFSLLTLSSDNYLFGLGKEFFSGGNFLYKKDTGVAGTIQFQIPLLTNENVFNQFYQTSILPADDGGCIVSGYTNSGSNTFDFYVQKYSSSGTIEFIKKFGTINHDYLSATIRTRNGGLLLVGTSSKNALNENQIPDRTLDFNSRVYIVKLDASFNLEWEKIIGGNFGSQGIDVNEDELRQVYILGKQASHGNDALNQFFILQLKSDGSNDL